MYGKQYQTMLKSLKTVLFSVQFENFNEEGRNQPLWSQGKDILRREQSFLKHKFENVDRGRDDQSEEADSGTLPGCWC